MDKPEKEYSHFPDRYFGNQCTVHNHCGDSLRWWDGTVECLLCARDRQPATKSENPAYFMPPYFEWNPPEGKK